MTETAQDKSLRGSIVAVVRLRPAVLSVSSPSAPESRITHHVTVNSRCSHPGEPYHPSHPSSFLQQFSNEILIFSQIQMDVVKFALINGSLVQPWKHLSQKWGPDSPGGMLTGTASLCLNKLHVVFPILISHCGLNPSPITHITIPLKYT